MSKAKKAKTIKQGDKGWQSLEVVHGDDVRPMAEVLEVSDGKCVRYARGDDGKLLVRDGALVTETIKGKFEVREAK